ncbi:MAG: cysteinyl-tRNA synthetase [Chloroflexi bacterium]|nr:cysteinyl-tRNA synthetase [Chloroflexota bacterium]
MTLGRIAFLGSGETSLAGGRIFESLARQLPSPLRISILETPAGFELNASLVAGRVGEFLKNRLGNYQPLIDLIPARKKGTDLSPDHPEILKPLLKANMIFMGPGSPTYAVRQLHDSLAWEIVKARHRQGATLVFASAATISVGAWVLPVYEIFKAGEDVHARPGLDFFRDFGLDLSFIPHWNNAEGGVDLDTSRCFVGMERFDLWRSMLPQQNVILGLDEHSGVILDFEKKACEVHGVSSVTVLHAEGTGIYPAGANCLFNELGGFTAPEPLDRGIRPEVWQMVLASERDEAENPPAQVMGFLKLREAARARKDFTESDRLREAILGHGWEVRDTPEGQRLVRLP